MTHVAFVISSGRISAVRALSPAEGMWRPSPSILIGTDAWQTYEQVWRSQPALRTVVSFIARNIAQLGLDVYRRRSATDRIKDVDHPLARLLEDPFPGSKWTKYRLMHWTIHELCIFDNAFWIKAKVGDSRALLPIPRRFIHPIGDDALQPEKYRLSGERGYTDLDPDQVVHFHGYNPEDPRVGVPPIETLRSILAEEYAATIYRAQLWRNGARTNGFVARPKDAPRWSPEARDRFKADWNAQYTGDGPLAGGTPLLEDGMEFRPSAITPKDAQYVESRKLTQREVAIAYHIAPVMLGILDDGATMSNVTQFHKMLYQDGLGPWLTQLGQDIERQLLGDFGDDNTYVEFNLAEKLRGSFEEQAAAISASVGGPWMTRSEARAMFNLPELPEADDLITPLNVVAGGLASPRDGAPDDPQNAESNGKPPKPRAPKFATGPGLWTSYEYTGGLK